MQEPVEQPEEAPVVTTRPDDAAAVAAAPPADLPLWIPSEGAVETRSTGASCESDLLTNFQEVQKAYEAIVPSAQGTAAELVADVRDSLLTLQNLIGAVVDGDPQTVAPAPPQGQAAAPAEPDTVTEPERQRKEQAASAVNVALRNADTHAALQDLPEWQHIQTVRGAVGHLWTVLKDRAGVHLNQLLGDGRVSGFLRDLSARVCDKIAGWAQAGAERLRKGPETPGELPITDALLRLGDAATAYSTPQAAKPVSRSDTPQLRQMGEALARPMPTDRRKASAAAARSRSTTAKRPQKKSAPGSNTEQATHLRRGGPDQPQPKRPTR